MARMPRGFLQLLRKTRCSTAAKGLIKPPPIFDYCFLNHQIHAGRNERCLHETRTDIISGTYESPWLVKSSRT